MLRVILKTIKNRKSRLFPIIGGYGRLSEKSALRKTGLIFFDFRLFPLIFDFQKGQKNIFWVIYLGHPPAILQSLVIIIYIIFFKVELKKIE